MVLIYVIDRDCADVNEHNQWYIMDLEFLTLLCNNEMYKFYS